jgi:hypothetical protein
MSRREKLLKKYSPTPEIGGPDSPLETCFQLAALIVSGPHRYAWDVEGRCVMVVVDPGMPRAAQSSLCYRATAKDLPGRVHTIVDNNGRLEAWTTQGHCYLTGSHWREGWVRAPSHDLSLEIAETRLLADIAETIERQIQAHDEEMQAAQALQERLQDEEIRALEREEAARLARAKVFTELQQIHGVIR